MPKSHWAEHRRTLAALGSLGNRWYRGATVALFLLALASIAWSAVAGPNSPLPLPSETYLGIGIALLVGSGYSTIHAMRKARDTAFHDLAEARQSTGTQLPRIADSDAMKAHLVQLKEWAARQRRALGENEGDEIPMHFAGTLATAFKAHYPERQAALHKYTLAVTRRNTVHDDAYDSAAEAADAIGVKFAGHRVFTTAIDDWCSGWHDDEGDVANAALTLHEGVLYGKSLGGPTPISDKEDADALGRLHSNVLASLVGVLRQVDRDGMRDADDQLRSSRELAMRMLEPLDAVQQLIYEPACPVCSETAGRERGLAIPRSRD
jgi:hypothetical protein